MAEYTVFGYYADNDQRYCDFFEADSTDEAEEQAREQAAREGGVLWVAATLRGHHPSRDRYTLYVDPRDPRNEGEEQLEDPEELLELAEFTVYGLVVSTRRHERHWNERTGGQRHISHEMADSTLHAEDVASVRVREKDPHFRLIVCAVLDGRMERAEDHPFSNPSECASR